MEITYDKDNKERVPFEHYLADYQKADPHELAMRTGTAYDDEKQSFRLKFIGRWYEVSFPEFSVSPESETEDYLPLVSMNAARILVIRFLLEGCAAGSTGKFLTYREVPWGEVYYRQFSGRCLSRLAFSYGNRLEQFCAALEKMGAKKLSQGDAGYEIEIFTGFWIRFLIWAGDEEFPPSAQILFSDNFAAAFHAEDLVVACDVLIGTMKAQI
ncbi:MAG: DUF3786 domain-containing protein [Lachnospiraceae bacterium]|nr:DUF3786 domain-containing protein [Lachnospiraceae bacterium]